MSNDVSDPFWDVRRPSARRSLLLCGVGAVAGLLIAGVGLFSARGTRTFFVPPEDAAIVNNVPILMADYVGQIRSLYDLPMHEATPAQKRKVLEDMIREELYVQRGVELGLPGDDIDVRQALVTATEASVGQDALASRPSEAELHAWYDSHQQAYASEGVMIAQDYIVPSNPPIAPAAVAAALRRGEAPSALGLKPSGRLRGDAEFYFAAKIHLGDGLFAVARTLGDGQISNPMTEGARVHVLVMAENRPPRAIAYENSRDRVLRDYQTAKIALLQAGAERFLRRRADIKIAPALR